MVQIEELQSSSKALAPGYSYVVDTGYDPSKLAINPTSRKRLRTGQPESSSDLTLRQHTDIQRHLARLDRDSHKDVFIPIPKSTLPPRKQTTNAKRVLGSGKTFQHYLEEDEARQAQRPDTTESAAAAAQRASKTPLARRKPLSASASKEPTPAPAVKQEPATSTAAAAQKPVFAPGTILAQPTLPTLSEETIEALLAAPMLSFNAARSAAPGPHTPRHRTFCEMCGYWGRARCMKCGARVCGIECKEQHEESRCLKFYA